MDWTYTQQAVIWEIQNLAIQKRYDGELSKVIIQAFARENGAFKPEAVKTEKRLYSEKRRSSSNAYSRWRNWTTDDEWKDLMQSAGYEVPEKNSKGQKWPAAILNIDVAAIKYINFSKRKTSLMLLE